MALALALFMLAFYVPFGYYFDLFFYRRRQRQKQKAREQPEPRRDGPRHQHGGRGDRSLLGERLENLAQLGDRALAEALGPLALHVFEDPQRSQAGVPSALG